MELTAAFDVMLSSLTAADASRRQVTGVLDWRTLVEQAQQAASQYLAEAGEAMEHDSAHVAGHDTPTHKSWRDLCQDIIRALDHRMGRLPPSGVARGRCRR